MDIPVEVILNLPSSLPVDARHNSKIDRTLLAQIAQNLMYELYGAYDEALRLYGPGMSTALNLVYRVIERLLCCSISLSISCAGMGEQIAKPWA